MGGHPRIYIDSDPLAFIGLIFRSVLDLSVSGVWTVRMKFTSVMELLEMPMKLRDPHGQWYSIIFTSINVALFNI